MSIGPRNALAFLAPIALPTLTLAQPFALEWNTIEPGGVVSDAQFELLGVIGQPDAGAVMSGSGFELSGGFLVGADPTCVADADDGSGTGTPDGGVTIDDLIYYLGQFEAGDADADVDDGSSTGTPDGGVTIDDLIYYLTRFEFGC